MPDSELTQSRNLVVLCDGTWNSWKDGAEATNVCKLSKSIVRDGTTPDPHYDDGVGAEIGRWGSRLDQIGRFFGAKNVGRFFEGALGLGFSENIREAYLYLATHYRPGDRIFLFGFSRGAFQVRSLANMLYRVGIVANADAAMALRLFDSYLYARALPSPGFGHPVTHYPGAQLQIRMLGVWDTVAALGTSMWGRDFGLSAWHGSFHEWSVPPIVERAHHAIAMDEFRSSYMPVVFDSPGAGDRIREQQWFRGAHADVGGGYVETGLSDIAFAWMCDRAKAAGLRIDTGDLELAPNPHAPPKDEVENRRIWSAAGLWPRMFPLPSGSSGDGGLGAWHPSVTQRTDGAGGSPKPWTTVEAGQTVECDIIADRIWNATGFILLAGQTYELTATGTWSDDGDPTGPAGRSSSDVWRASWRQLREEWSWKRLGQVLFPARMVMGWAKRHPSAPWMQLIGMLNAPTVWERRWYPWRHLLWAIGIKDPVGLTERQFPIGNRCILTPTASAPLYCFANDLWLFYRNNTGRIRLAIREIGRVEPVRPPAETRISALAVASLFLLGAVGAVYAFN